MSEPQTVAVDREVEELIMAVPADPSGELEILRKKSLVYAEKSTALSQCLADAEAYFQSLPGKVGIHTDGREVEDVLAFEKVESEWRLVLHYFDEEGGGWKNTNVTSASIQIKISAAKLLPELYRRLEKHFDVINSTVDQGLISLRGLPFFIERSGQMSTKRPQSRPGAAP